MTGKREAEDGAHGLTGGSACANLMQAILPPRPAQHRRRGWRVHLVLLLTGRVEHVASWPVRPAPLAYGVAGRDSWGYGA